MWRRTGLSLCLYKTPNFTEQSNKVRHQELRGKFGLELQPKGIPRKSRDDCGKITLLHETKRCLVAGRNKINGFNANQYLIACKETGQCVMVDCGDDWPDDWVTFMHESNLKLQFIFFTHVHIDNIIGVPPLLGMMPGTKVAWNYSDYEWIERFPEVCARYGRSDMEKAQLPFLDGNLMSSVPGNSKEQNILLSSLTNKDESFFLIGKLMLFHIWTPGHSPGHTVLHVPQEKLLFSGDLLFYNSVGRVDLPFASGQDLAQSLRKLEQMPDNTMVLPGHSKMTTMGRERKHNAALRRVYEQLAFGKQVVSVGFNERGYF